MAAAHDRYRAQDDLEAMRAPVLAIMELGSRVLAINTRIGKKLRKAGIWDAREDVVGSCPQVTDVVEKGF